MAAFQLLKRSHSSCGIVNLEYSGNSRQGRLSPASSSRAFEVRDSWLMLVNGRARWQGILASGWPLWGNWSVEGILLHFVYCSIWFTLLKNAVSKLVAAFSQEIVLVLRYCKLRAEHSGNSRQGILSPTYYQSGSKMVEVWDSCEGSRSWWMYM